MIRRAIQMARALRAASQTYGARLLVADALRGLADRLHPGSAAWRDERIEALQELGRWTYNGAVWTSTRTMLKSALDRARHDDTWRGEIA